MKKAILSALAVFAVSVSAFAGSSKAYKQLVAPEQFFKDTEFSLDAFYSYNSARSQTPVKDVAGCVMKPQYLIDGSGGGVGANFFFARYFGVGVQGNWWEGVRHDLSQKEHDRLLNAGEQNDNGTVIYDYPKRVANQLTGNLILRYPIEYCTFGVAPYLFGGGGAVFSEYDNGFFDVGTGIEFRFSPHFGVFADWRWNFMTGGKNDDNTTRAGVRFVF